MNPFEAVMWGCLGGILPDVLRLVSLRYGEAPNYLRQGFFWLSLLLLVVVAGLAAYLLSPQRVIDAIALGFSAPEILSSALGSKKPRSSGRARTKDSAVVGKKGSAFEIFITLKPLSIDLKEGWLALSRGTLGQLRDWWAH